MKKPCILMFIVLTVIVSVNAQWVDDPANNTLLANVTNDAGEIYTSTDPVSGYTYIQWTNFASNGWSPTLQCLDFNGVPQWGLDGIHPSHHNCSSWSQGISMVATTDNAAVTCFANSINDGTQQQCIAIKIKADGTYAWGEEGIDVFNRNDCTRTELLAGDDGGVWALSTNTTQTWLRYIDTDGTLHPEITISDPSANCTFALMVPAENGVFVVYEKMVWQYSYYYEKELFVAGYTKDGSQFSAPTRLMAPHVIAGSYIHYVIPDGIGGGYVYMWYLDVNDNFNVFVFHFNANGASTIVGEEGVAVHSLDNTYMYTGAYATVDPISHDLIIAYNQTDSYSQSLCRIWVNRITSSGYKVWDDGYMVLNNGTTPCGDIRVDAFEYGGGFSIIYHKSIASNSMQSTIEAHGFDMNHNELWSTQLCSTTYSKTSDQNTPGFYMGQNISVWVNSQDGGLYGQNIGQNGEMGEITPPTPPTPCHAPANFDGEVHYDPILNLSSVLFSWTAPETQPLHYNLYYDELKEIIHIDGNATSYHHELASGDYMFKLSAVYEDCESDYALTPDGYDFLIIEIPDHTSVQEVEHEKIIYVVEVYNINGQTVKINDITDLNQGIHIIKGVTESGKTVVRKIVK